MYLSPYTFGAMTGSAVTACRTILAFAGMFALVALAGLAEPGLALTMAPALVLLALLTGGVRPGEALLERLRDRRSAPRKLARAQDHPRPRLALVVRPPHRRAHAGARTGPPPPAARARRAPRGPAHRARARDAPAPFRACPSPLNPQIPLPGRTTPCV